MSFRIAKQTTLLASGFRAALRGQLARAIKELDISARTPRATRIHSARRRVKKVRSALRLLKGASFRGLSQTDHDLLRDASAEVASARNADANMKALEELCIHSGCDHLRFSKAFALLEKQKNAVSRDTAASMHKAATLLKGALSRIDSWDDRSIAWQDIARSLEQFYKRGRAAFRKAVDDSTAENLHRWRRRVKDIFHGLKLVRTANSKAIPRFARQTEKLSALLGIDHDLALLEEALDQGNIGKENAVLGKLISARRRKLQSKAFKFGAEFFSRKPSAFIGKIDG